MPQSDNQSQMQAYLTSSQNSSDSNWYPDTGATHHLTSELANLNVRADAYSGPDQIKIGNGAGLSVKHVGISKLISPSFNFKLFDVLHVPNICKNLISVHKFTKDTNTFFEFHPSYFLLKDRTTGKLLHRGPSNHGLYSVYSNSNKKRTPCALVGERVSVSQWHSRLGHPALKVVRHVLSSFKLLVFSNKQYSMFSVLRLQKHTTTIFIIINTDHVTSLVNLH
jgi:hypothetical protein